MKKNYKRCVVGCRFLIVLCCVIALVAAFVRTNGILAGVLAVLLLCYRVEKQYLKRLEALKMLDEMQL